MRYLFIMTAGLTVVFALLGLGARGIGASSTPTLATMLEAGNCSQPCWRGIQPGRTTFAEARMLLRNDPIWDNVTFDSNGRLTWEMTDTPGWRGSATGSRYTETRTIQSVDLIPPRGTVKLGEIVTLIDTPRRLRFCDRSRSDHIHLFFEGNLEVVAVNPEGGSIDQIEPDLVIRSIRYYSSGASGIYNAYDWQGFVSKNVMEGC
ncbi:MAG: hypothetical protein IT324_29760 [Anaerolineae bacterium]|nr:hypothetical protein [Anaerolineae bacterium]